MNSKLIKGVLAGVAVVALAAGSTTFAAWSDWDSVTDNQAGADELTLVLGEPNAADFDNLKLAPGQGADYEFVVASRQGQTITNADLRMQITNLVGKEDGCTSTNSEIAADSDCNDTATAGEFIDQAVIGVNVSAPTTDADACSAAHPRGSVRTAIPLSQFLNQTNSAPLRLLPAGEYLNPGERICVAMGLNMPASATNASQGDSGSFDLKFLLDQVVS